MKRHISIILLCALTHVGTCQNYDFSAVTTSGHTIYYKIASAIAQTAEVTHPNEDYVYPWQGYSMPTGNLVIDDSVVNGGVTYHVDAIGDSAFTRCTGLTSVTLPNSVVHIKQAAFAACSGLTSITFPSFLTSIGNNAFYWCNGLTRLTLPNSINSIGTGAFASCQNLTSVNIPLQLSEIKYRTFSQCPNLTTVVFNDSLHHIRSGAFEF